MVSHIERRKFLATLGGAAAAWPFAARAQQQTMPVAGFLNAASPGPSAPHVAAFREGLKEVGYVEGQNVAIEFRWAEDKNERLHALVADLVNRNVRVIALPGSTPAAHAAKAVTANIPIVFGVGGDPIKLGLVGSLNRPGGNLTGVTAMAVELAPKQLELLHELMPTTTAVAVLVNPTSPALAETTLGDLHAATRTRGLQLHVVHASTDSDLDTAFASVANLRVGGLVIGSDAFFTSRAQKLASLATNHRIPAVYWNRDFANAGGLMSYGTSYKETYRIAGIYTGRLLKGERPAELPVQQNAKVELVINIKTAKALGITFPLTLLARADEVIE